MRQILFNPILIRDGHEQEHNFSHEIIFPLNEWIHLENIATLWNLIYPSCECRGESWEIRKGEVLTLPVRPQNALNKIS